MKLAYIKEAILAAEKSNLKVANHGAVVVFRGKVISYGYNKLCVENKNKVNRWSIHAEVDAINNALRKISSDDLTKSTLIVIRLLKDGSDIKEINQPTSVKNQQICNRISYSKPCQNCTNFIIRHGLKKCYYS